METKHTKGEWEIEGNSIFPKGKGYSIAIISKISAINSKLKPEEEFEANAKLIAEAGTVSNECGLTPRQLLQQRTEMLKVLQEIVHRRKGAGWDAECCALLAESIIKKATE